MELKGSSIVALANMLEYKKNIKQINYLDISYNSIKDSGNNFILYFQA